MPEGITPSGVFRAIHAVGETLRAEMTQARTEHTSQIASSHKETTEHIERVRERLHALANTLSIQNAENARWQGEHAERIRTVDNRVDDLKKEVDGAYAAARKSGGPGKAGWIGIAIAAISGAATAVAAYFTGKGAS